MSLICFFLKGMDSYHWNSLPADQEWSKISQNCNLFN